MSGVWIQGTPLRWWESWEQNLPCCLDGRDILAHLSISDTSQSCVLVSSCMLKWVDGAFLQVFHCPVTQHEQQLEKMQLVGFMHLGGSTCWPSPSCRTLVEIWLVGRNGQVNNLAIKMLGGGGIYNISFWIVMLASWLLQFDFASLEIERSVW